jgi:murein L,D-transpeptidase YcbB/YkuD
MALRLSICRAVLLLLVAVISTPVLHAQANGEFFWTTNPNAPDLLQRDESLRNLLRHARIDELRWPDFSDYRAQVEKFYSRRDNRPAWVRNGQPTFQAVQLIDILRQADSQGLRAEDYDASRWLARVAALQGAHSPADEMRFDAALTVCAMRYVSDLRAGRIDPRYFNFGLSPAPGKLDLAAFLAQRVVQVNDVKSELAAIEPRFAGYRDLRQALLRYTALASEDDGEKLPLPTASGYPGPPYPGVARLTRLLRRLGDLPQHYTAGAHVYDAALLQAVRHFQQRHGLPATGYLDAATVEQLNVPLSYRVEQIRLALERLRWMRLDLGQPTVVVNIPALRLDAFDREGKVALTMSVEVGDNFDDSRTPVLEERIEYLVFRPYWDVPLAIQRDDFVPWLAEHPRWLSQNGFDVIAPAGRRAAGVVTRDVLQQLRTGRIRIRQRPGPYNPMGALKFMFPNRYEIYLHDIPQRDFQFILSQRLVSHGCVHVEKPAELAAWMLRDQRQWSVQRVQQAMRQGRKNLKVDLPRPVPVLIVYATAAAQANGDIHFYRDIYGYDADLQQVLAKGYPYPR